MPASLLKTKLFIPSIRGERVSRPRLTARLNEGLAGRKLNLVCAPAGFGKTTLVAEWTVPLRDPADKSQPSVSWLSLDASDNDLVRFWTYAIAALQTIDPHLGETALAMLQMPQPPSIEVILTDLINEITARPTPLILVLDDYHLIEMPAIHQAIAFLLDHLPPQLHLIILTRADPPLPLPRLRARGQMIEIRAADLRFTADEAAAFLNQVMGLELTNDDVAVLEARTEGWIAGLQLAALSLQDRADTTSFISAFAGSHHYVVDYLVEEVLRRQPEEVHDFLIKTSILERLGGPLCDALTGCTDGQATLEALQRANLFVVPLDNQRRWYRYHHLFADMLHSRLHRTWPDQVLELNRRASEWHEQQGSFEEAISYALAGKDFERAATLIQQYAPIMLAEGRIAGLSTWINRLPEDTLAAHPRLELAYIWALFFGLEFDKMEACLERLERRVTPETSTSVQGELVLIRGVVARLNGELDRCVVLFKHALEHLSPEDTLSRGRAWLHLGLAYLNENIDQAEHAFAQACTSFESAASLHGLLAAHYFLAVAQTMRGALSQAATICQKAILLAERSPNVPAASYAYVAMGELLYEQNDLERAFAYLIQGAELAERAGHAETLVKAAIALARLHRARGEWTAAQHRIDQFERTARHMPPSALPLHPVSDEQVSLWLVQGQLHQAVARVYADTASGDSGRTGAPIPRLLGLINQLVRARLDIVQNKTADALDLLDRLLQTAPGLSAGGDVSAGAGMVKLTLQTLTLQARALSVCGQIDRAISTLGRALTMAEPAGYIRTFVDEGTWLLPLLVAFKQQCQDTRLQDYADRLIAAFGPLSTSESAPLLSDGVYPPPPGIDARSRSLIEQAALVEPLSERELEVLRLLAEGKSNQEIGDALYIAVGTVKKHLSNIFGKLGVQNRTECAARARELSLL